MRAVLWGSAPSRNRLHIPAQIPLGIPILLLKRGRYQEQIGTGRRFYGRSLAFPAENLPSVSAASARIREMTPKTAITAAITKRISGI